MAKGPHIDPDIPEASTPAPTPPQVLRVGLVGRSIALSRTPAMHVAEGRALGLDYRYKLLDVDAMTPARSLGEILDWAEGEGFAGLNVTFPFKREVMQHLDVLSEAAQKVGAVNTVVFDRAGRRGHNTDFWGFTQSLRAGLGGADFGAVLLLGAGGAGGAVAHGLRELGARDLYIYDNDEDASAALALELGARAVRDPAEVAGAVTGIVNATPMGMAKLPGMAIDAGLITPRHWVSDIVYFPRETALLAAARAKGCRVLDGSGMAVFQAVRAFHLFSGLQPDPTRMRATFEAFVDP